MAAIDTVAAQAVRPRDALRRLGPTGSHVLALGIVLTAVFVTASALSETFLTSDNLLNVLRQIAVLGILAAATTMLMVSGGIDLSIGATASWAGVLAAEVLTGGGSPLAAVLVGLGLGLAVGALNGAAIVWSHAPPLILTLGTMSMLEGFSMATTNAEVVPIDGFAWLGTGELAGLPVPALAAAAVLVAVGLLLRYTRLGRDAFAIGGNERASFVAGIAIGRTKLTLYVISGGLAGLAGLVLLSRVGAAAPTGGLGLELQAVAAVVIGGASLAGGRGSIVGTCMGVVLLGVITNVLNLLNVQSYYQSVATGAVIAIAVIFGEVGRRWRAERGAGV
jgi:ribose transport system permease protein